MNEKGEGKYEEEKKVEENEEKNLQNGGRKEDNGERVDLCQCLGSV